MIGWQLSRFDAVLSECDIETLLGFGTQLANFVVHANSTAAVAYQRQTGEVGISLPDPIAMAVLLDPELKLETSHHYVAINCGSELTRGMTVVDRLNVAVDARNSLAWSGIVQRGHKIEICWRLNVAGWKALLLSALGTRE